MFDQYRQFIGKYVDLDDYHWSMFTSRLKTAGHSKGEIIHHAGEVCRYLYFINKGIARAFITDTEGRDYTWSIFFNDKNAQMVNLFVVDYDSFINRSESKLSIEVIEDCELVGFNADTLEMLYNMNKNAERFGRMMSQSAYSYIHNSIIDRKIKKAGERFEDLLRNYPYLLEKVPQYHIATYLGITPQHLSRLKKEYKLT